MSTSYGTYKVQTMKCETAKSVQVKKCENKFAKTAVRRRV